MLSFFSRPISRLSPLELIATPIRLVSSALKQKKKKKAHIGRLESQSKAGPSLSFLGHTNLSGSSANRAATIKVRKFYRFNFNSHILHSSYRIISSLTSHRSHSRGCPLKPTRRHASGSPGRPSAWLSCLAFNSTSARRLAPLT
jgi:hypothetical protein